MKGDGNINIELNFIGINYDKCPTIVKIYSKDKLIYKGITNNGKIYVKLPSNQGFRLLANSSNTAINTTFYTDTCKYTFLVRQNTNTIIFFLIDEYYKIPIERGKIILCQR